MNGPFIKYLKTITAFCYMQTCILYTLSLINPMMFSILEAHAAATLFFTSWLSMCMVEEG